MRGILIIAAVFLATVRSTNAGGVQLFNTEVLGQPTSQAVTLLAGPAEGDAEPYVVSSDIACGSYYAASVYYRTPVTFQLLRSALNRRYAAFETPSPEQETLSLSPDMGLWRVIDPDGTRAERRGFAIQLSTDDEGVRVIYIAVGETSAVCEGDKGNQ
jgi:hypothetical protein